MRKWCLAAWMLLPLGAGGEEASLNWLPPPDGFVWPDAVEVEEPSSQTVAAADLTAARRAAIRGHWPEDELPEQLEVKRIDLNADGRKEWMVHVPAYSGSGGPAFLIFTPEGGSLRSIGMHQGHLRFLQPHQGWLQLENASRGGAGSYSRSLMRFEEGRYRYLRIEHHDLQRQRIELIDPEGKE